jgi:hypothetical protein
MLALLLGACAGGGGRVEPPGQVLKEYAAAARGGDAARVWSLLDEDTQAEVSAEALGELMQDNRAELGEQAAELERIAGEGIEARANVPLASGESVALVLEDGRWVVDGGVLDAPALRTPRDAVLSLRRALRRRSFRGVSRVLAREPRAELESEIDRLLEETADERDLRVEVQGNQARVLTTNGREITLVREAGEWRVLSID